MCQAIYFETASLFTEKKGRELSRDSSAWNIINIVGEEEEEVAVRWLTISPPPQGRLLEYADEDGALRCAFELSTLGCLGCIML